MRRFPWAAGRRAGSEMGESSWAQGEGVPEPVHSQRGGLALPEERGPGGVGGEPVRLRLPPLAPPGGLQRGERGPGRRQGPPPGQQQQQQHLRQLLYLPVAGGGAQAPQLRKSGL